MLKLVTVYIHFIGRDYIRRPAQPIGVQETDGLTGASVEELLAKSCSRTLV